MTLSAPKQVTLIVAVLIALLAILAVFVTIPLITQYAFWFLALAFVLLAIGTLVEGL
jgi:hypothetical protein